MPKVDTTITDCLHAEIGYGGDMTFVIGSNRSESRVCFDLGQRLVISRGEDGLLVLSIEQPDQPTGTK